MAVDNIGSEEQTASKPVDNTTVESVPIIDLSCFGDNVISIEQTAQQVKVAAQLRDACIQVGFFYIRGHGCPVQVREDAFAAMKALFELPLELKQELDAKQSPLYRGYNGIQTGAHSCTPQDKDALPDQKESFTIGAEAASKAKSSPMHGPNQWPSQQLPEFEPAMKKYWDTLLHVVAVRLMKALAMSLQLDNDQFFLNQCDNPVAQMVLLRYPADDNTGSNNNNNNNNNNENRPRGCGAHTDCGFLTILAQQDNVAGLEVQPSNSTVWMPAPPIPDTFVVNLGDMAARWTNDLYQSTPHRVQSPSLSNNTQSETTNAHHVSLARHSVPFFLNCNFDTRVECLPGCGEPKYPPTLAGEYILEKLGLMYMLDSNNNDNDSDNDQS